MSKTGFAIWWLSQENCLGIVEVDKVAWPSYLESECQSRIGRAGRGRLWIHKDIPVKGIDWDESRPCARLAGECGGIVIRAEDVHHVIALPGFVTDLEMNYWKLDPKN